MLEYHLTTTDERLQICKWQYPHEYAAYNLPSYEELKRQKSGLGNPQRDKNFYSYYDAGKLVGFTNILEEDEEVFIGIGVKPECCSQGYGQRILDIAYHISKQLYPTKPLYLEVRTWNKRAIRCYEKVGFIIDGDLFEHVTSMGKGIFYRMIRL